MALHGDITADTGIHKPAAFEYADETNRLADTRAVGPKTASGTYRPLTASDIGKLSYQQDTSKYYTLTAIGDVTGGYGDQGTLTFVAVAATGAGTGDMSGPGASTSGNVVLWNNTAGTLTKNSTLVGADLVSGPASSTDTALMRYSGTGGKTALNSGVALDGSGNFTGTIGNFDGRDVSTDGGTLDTHVAATANPHATDIANLGSGTKAELVANISDATALLSDVSEDTSPTLGGNLDLSTFDIITSASNNPIELKPNGSGNILLGDSGATGVVTCGRLALGTTATITSSASMTMDCKAANTFYLTLDHVGATLAITGSSLVSGSTGVLWITQGSGGSKTITTWPTEFKFGGSALTFSTGAGDVDLLTWTTNGTVCLVSAKPGAGAA